MSVSAIIVTRGDVELTPIIDKEDGWPEAVHEIVIWDNAALERRDLKVYGRYAAIAEASHSLIYVQDDDVVLPNEAIEEIIGQSENGGAEYGRLVVNMPANFRHSFYQEHALVGFGACFHRNLPHIAFGRFWEQDVNTWLTHPLAGFKWIDPPERELFLRTCDIVFTGLTPYTMVDVVYEELPWTADETRMWKQPTHLEERQRMLKIVKQVRAQTAI